MGNFGYRPREVRQLVLTVLAIEVLFLTVPGGIVYAITGSAVAGVLAAVASMLCWHFAWLGVSMSIRAGYLPRLTGRFMQMISKPN